jgi:hypothetical protein
MPSGLVMTRSPEPVTATATNRGEPFGVPYARPSHWLSAAEVRNVQSWPVDDVEFEGVAAAVGLAVMLAAVETAGDAELDAAPPVELAGVAVAVGLVATLATVETAGDAELDPPGEVDGARKIGDTEGESGGTPGAPVGVGLGDTAAIPVWPFLVPARVEARPTPRPAPRDTAAAITHEHTSSTPTARRWRCAPVAPTALMAPA